MKQSIGILLICVLVLFNTTSIKAIPIDSLRVSVRTMSCDTLKVLELAQLSKKYTKYQLDTSLVLGTDALALAQKLEYVYGEAYSLYVLGIVYRYKGEYDLSIEYSQKAYKIFGILNNVSYKGKALNSLGNVYKRKGDFDNSLQSFHRALKIFQEIEDSSLISSVLNNIAILYYDMDQYDQALRYQIENLAIKKKLKLDSEIPIALMNIGNIYKETKEYDLALEYYKQSLDLLNSSNINLEKAWLLHNIANIYEELKNYKIAHNYYIKALSIKKEIGDKKSLINSLQGIGNVLIKTGNFLEGEKYLLESFLLAKEIGDLPKQSVVALNLQEVYENQNQFEKSLEYLKIYNKIQGSIFNEEYISQVTSLEQKYEAEKREQQIAFLEKEQSIQKLELSKREIETKQKSFQRNALIIAIVIVLALTFYFAIENKKRKRINNLLIKQNKKITDQRTEIALQNDELLESNKTKDRLFQIIAHDLRSPLVSMDSITQLIPYWIEEQDYDSLKKLSKTLELSVNNVLSLIDNLLNWALNQQGKFPYKPENLNLKENILETIEVYRLIAEIKNIDLKFTFTKNIMVFADRNMLSTVVRNLLNNAIKFTPEKGEIIVGIDSNKQFAKVWVKDSGIGIPHEKKEMAFELANDHGKGTKGETGKGLGLFFCKEFVSMNNGDIFIDSEHGKGTTITFTLPLFTLQEN